MHVTCVILHRDLDPRIQTPRAVSLENLHRVGDPRLDSSFRLTVIPSSQNNTKRRRSQRRRRPDTKLQVLIGTPPCIPELHRGGADTPAPEKDPYSRILSLLPHILQIRIGHLFEGPEVRDK